MSAQDIPQLYIITPDQFELSQLQSDMTKLLDAADIACVRLSMASHDEDEICRAADALRDICHARDVPIVIDGHFMLVERLGLDGVHLPRGARNIRKLRDELGADAIIGAACGDSRHDGMNAAEAGADYISFGPLSASSLGDGTVADLDLFSWWSDMIELPVVAEGGLTLDQMAPLAQVTDFIALGAEIWDAADPVAQLQSFIRAMQG